VAAEVRPLTGVPSGVDRDLVVSAALTVPASELRWRFSRSSGPGGQGVNTADSRVELSWDAAGSPALAALPAARRARVLDSLADRLVDGVLTVTASEHRQQLRNRAAARERLAALLARALAPPPPPRRATRPTAGSRRRKGEAKRARSATKALRRRPGGAGEA
jgi:ribosome-associated protein